MLIVPCILIIYIYIQVYKTTTLSLLLDSLFPKTEISYMRAVRGEMEDRKMRKRTWEAAGWPWGW
jgi:hypothetical protein